MEQADLRPVSYTYRNGAGRVGVIGYGNMVALVQKKYEHRDHQPKRASYP